MLTSERATLAADARPILSAADDAPSDVRPAVGARAPSALSWPLPAPESRPPCVRKPALPSPLDMTDRALAASRPAEPYVPPEAAAGWESALQAASARSARMVAAAAGSMMSMSACSGAAGRSTQAQACT
eukprot:227193-Chlamydomonas_euryale.AAC.1